MSKRAVNLIVLLICAALAFVMVPSLAGATDTDDIPDIIPVSDSNSVSESQGNTEGVTAGADDIVGISNGTDDTEGVTAGAADLNTPADTAQDAFDSLAPRLTDILATKIFVTGEKKMGIAFTSDQEGIVFIYLLDENGERVHTISNKTLPKGTHTIYWDGVNADKTGYIKSGKYTLQISLKASERYSQAFEQPLEIISKIPYIPPQEPVYVLGAGERTKINIQKTPGKGSLGVIHGATAIVELIKYEGNYAYIQGYTYAGRLVKGYVSKSMLKSVTPNDTYLVEVDKKTQRVKVYKKGKLVREMKCSTGLNFDTPCGEYLTGTKLSAFYVHGLTAKYATRFNGGIYYHEVPSRNGNYRGFEEKLGQRASAGCVRLPRGDAKWMYDNIPAMTKIVIR